MSLYMMDTRNLSPPQVLVNASKSRKTSFASLEKPPTCAATEKNESTMREVDVPVWLIWNEMPVRRRGI